MHKKVLIIIALSLLIALPVNAHLTGAFADFLAIVYDKTTIEKLQTEMDETKREIEELTPKIATAEKAFKKDQEAAVEQLQFYSDVGLDTLYAMIHQGSDVVDLLGSQWIIESKMNDYLDDLNDLYIQYQQLLNSKQALEGHEQLLLAIEKSLRARETYLKETEGLDLEIIANYLDIDWTSEVEEHIINDFNADVETVSTQLLDWVEESSSLPYSLNEQWLNKKSKAHYYFRSDHIYIEYEIKNNHVLLLGQVLQNKENTAAKLTIEAGFYNGFFLPEELLVELPSIQFPYAKLNELEGVTSPYLIQSNGKLELYSK